LEALPEVPIADHIEVLYLTDAHRLYGQGRTIESQACRLAEEIAGVVYVRLETDTGQALTN
jgi:hypothetical protein